MTVMKNDFTDSPSKFGIRNTLSPSIPLRSTPSGAVPLSVSAKIAIPITSTKRTGMSIFENFSIPPLTPMKMIIAVASIKIAIYTIDSYSPKKPPAYPSTRVPPEIYPKKYPSDAASTP